ncbi:MAG TPA: sulfite exporter TauE/SafE family protein [Actinomycetes bacterium]|jgi:hypothetical protein|nr:sulfite exporter TauE/SafE family protein [Actinomycetes bacterium]
MTPLEAIVVTVAGMAAGTINAIVGAGTLITFPVLLAIGYPAVVANVSNTIGLVPGVFSGVLGYRRELTGQRDRLIRLGLAGALGGLTGAVLLLSLPASVFDAVVPVLILLGVALVLAQPYLARFVGQRHDPPPHGGPLLLAGVYLIGVYGGYFGAAQGVLLLGLLGLLLAEGLQRANAAKNVIALLINLVAALVFIAVAEVAWLPVVLIAAGSIVGGYLGARVGRRLPEMWLRVVVAVVGITVAVRMLLG